MKDNTTIHTLAKPRVKSGQIKFICYRDGKEKTFSTCINSLSGDRMSWFNDDPPSVDNGARWAKSVFSDIRVKATKVIDVIGDF